MPTVTVPCPICHLPLTADCTVIDNSDGDENHLRWWREMSDFEIQPPTAPITADDVDVTDSIDHDLCMAALDAFVELRSVRQSSPVASINTREHPHAHLKGDLWDALSRAALEADAEGGYDGD